MPVSLQGAWQKSIRDEHKYKKRSLDQKKIEQAFFGTVIASPRQQKVPTGLRFYCGQAPFLS
jgi:hypothetical protein